MKQVAGRKQIVIDSLTDEEVMRLTTSHKNFKEQYVIDVLDQTGIRVGELIDIRESLINWQDKKLTVFGKLTKPKIKGSGEKKERIVPLTDVALDRLKTFFYIEKNEKLDMTKNGVAKLVKRVAKRAGIAKRVRPHVLRHTFGYRWIRKGGDYKTLQQILGHSDPSTTMRYGRPNMNDIVDDLNKVFGGKK